MDIWSSIDSPAVLSAIASRLNQLRMTPYEKLKGLPDFINDTVTIDNKEVRFTTYRNSTENDGVEIVLQVSIQSHKVMHVSFAQVSADGFRMSPKGKIHTMQKKDLYEYM